jgi:dipeptidyl aminopeptidase/acylaminoacyl peptidase
VRRPSRSEEQIRGRTADPLHATPIVVSRADGSHRRRISPSDAFAVAPSWSPDGRWIAYITVQSPDPPGVPFGKVKIAPVNRRTPARWLAHDYDGHDPVWSPTGRAVVFGWGSDEHIQGLGVVGLHPGSRVTLGFDCRGPLKCSAIGRPTFGPGDGALGFMTSAGRPLRSVVSVAPPGPGDRSFPILRLPAHTCCMAWWTPVTGAGQSSV